MKGLILILSLIVGMGSIAGAAAVSMDGEAAASVAQPWMEPVAAEEIPLGENCCECDDYDQNGCGEESIESESAEGTDSSPDRDLMVREVEMLWTMWFDDEGAKQTDSRRDRFEEYAEDLVDAVIMYQQEPTDIGGQLPGHQNDHLVMAFMAAKESSVTADVVGKSHQEVGLMQLHGVSLAGYAPEKVQHNAKLGVLLGVRWLTSQLPKCKTNPGLFDTEWEDADWVGPLSVYAGGPKALRKDGRCARYGEMRERIDKVRFYRSRIDAEMKKQEE